MCNATMQSTPLRFGQDQATIDQDPEVPQRTVSTFKERKPLCCPFGIICQRIARDNDWTCTVFPSLWIRNEHTFTVNFLLVSNARQNKMQPRFCYFGSLHWVDFIDWIVVQKGTRAQKRPTSPETQSQIGPSSGRGVIGQTHERCSCPVGRGNLLVMVLGSTPVSLS